MKTTLIIDRAIPTDEAAIQDAFAADDAILLIRTGHNVEDLAAASAAFDAPIIMLAESSVRTQGCDRVRRFIRQTPTARVLIYLDENQIKSPEEFLLAGCFGFVASTTPPSLWEMIVRRVAHGQMWVEHSVLTSAFRTALAALDAPLFSHREGELLFFLAQGLSNQGIAERMFVTQETIRWHLRNLYAKVGVTGRHALIAYAGRLAAAMDHRRQPDAVPLGEGGYSKDLRESLDLPMIQANRGSSAARLQLAPE